MFSDETKIEIGNNRKVYVWRKVDERLRPECNFLYNVVEVRSKFQQQQFLGPQHFECHLFVVELLFL
jgi:hypothetical protein